MAVSELQTSPLFFFFLFLSFFPQTNKMLKPLIMTSLRNLNMSSYFISLLRRIQIGFNSEHLLPQVLTLPFSFNFFFFQFFTPCSFAFAELYLSVSDAPVFVCKHSMFKTYIYTYTCVSTPIFICPSCFFIVTSSWSSSNHVISADAVSGFSSFAFLVVLAGMCETSPVSRLLGYTMRA